MDDFSAAHYIFEWILSHIVESICVLSIFVEIVPVKFNPVSAFFNLLFKPVRKDIDDMKQELQQNINNVKDELKQNIDSISNQQTENTKTIEELVKSNDSSEISRIRWEVIEFANSIDNGQLHKKDEYLHIKEDNKSYHKLIEKYGLENGIIDEEMEKINRHYNQNKNTTSVYF